MGIAEILLVVLPLASGIAATAGYGVIALTPAEFRHSKVAFATAGALAATALFIWGITTDVGIGSRIIVTSLFGAVLLPATIEAIRWVSQRQVAQIYEQSAASETIFKDPAKKATIASPKAPLNMWQIFDTDFPGIGRTMMSARVSVSGSRPEDFQFASYWDISSNSYYLAFYFHARENNFTLVFLTANFVKQAIDMLNQMQFVVTTPGQTKQTSLIKMRFSNQVYLYVDNYLLSSQVVDLEQAYSTLGYDVDVRGDTYLALHKNDLGRDATSNAPIFKEGEAKVRLPTGVDGMEITFKNVPMTTPVQPIINHLVPKNSPQAQPAPPVGTSPQTSP